MARLPLLPFFLLSLIAGCTDNSNPGTTLSLSDNPPQDDEQLVDQTTPPDKPPETPQTDIPEIPIQPTLTGDPCIDGAVLSAVVDLVVDPDGAGCPWGQADNLGEAQGILTARDETTARILRADNGSPFTWLEQGAHLCDLRLDSVALDDDPVAADFVYDDLLIVAINDSVVLASDARVNEQFETDGQHYTYDWARVRGLELMFEGDQAYCMGYGNGSDCALPSADTTGEFLLSFSGALFEPIRQRALEDQRLELRFITIGDNDADTDCRHNGFRMRAVVDVALPGTFGEVVP